MTSPVRPLAGTRIAVIGFGFSGLMVVANLVRNLAEPTTIYIIAEDISGLGLAYGTENTGHLLNVPAGRMGAFADEPRGFVQWLASGDGALAMQRLGLSGHYTETAFVPRTLYGCYLQHIWQETQAIAAQKKCMIKLVESRATRVRSDGELAVLTARGDAIAVDSIVLAVGNETKPILPQVKSDQVIQNPWASGVFAGAAMWQSPVLLMGAGLTAVDTVLSLRAHGYAGEIIAFSRHGRWPEAHAPKQVDFKFTTDELFAQKTLKQLVRYVRKTIGTVGDWRVVLDALRPHTPLLWQGLSTRDQQRFLARLLSVWNVHRHRMAPTIADNLRADELLQTHAVAKVDAQVEEGVLSVTLHVARSQGEQCFKPSRVINCTGSELNATKSRNPLLIQALADGVVEPHANGLGMVVDPDFRAWGNAYPNLYIIGNWMTGQFLESTAVQELRTQAASIGRALAASCHAI